MAKCDQGYLCEVCGQDVAEISDSDLYLRFVIGEISIGQLTSSPERHIRCNPVQAQFIVDPDFEPVTVEGPFDKQMLDAADVAKREELITRGWRRLQEITGSGLPIIEYPLPEVIARRRERKVGVPPLGGRPAEAGTPTDEEEPGHLRTPLA